MYPVSDKFKAAIKESHTIVSYLVAIDYREQETTMLVIDGYITISVESPVMRGLNATVVMAEGDDLATVRQAMSPYYSRYSVYSGVQFPDGTEEVAPCGIFYATSVQEKDEGTWEITALDLAGKCQDGLLQPYFIPTGTNTATAIPPLLAKKLPLLEVNLMPTTYTTPAMLLREGDEVWDQARKLAAATGCDLYFSRTGVVTSTPIVQAPGFIAWEYAEGKNADFWGPERNLTTDDKPNVVVVKGTSANSTVRGEASDLTPTSPTYRYGPYGEVVHVETSDRVSNNTQATDMARSILQRKLGSSDQVRFSAVPNPALDPWDTIRIIRDRVGLNDHFYIAEMRLPLSTGQMDIVGHRFLLNVPAEDSAPPQVECGPYCDEFDGANGPLDGQGWTAWDGGTGEELQIQSGELVMTGENTDDPHAVSTNTTCTNGMYGEFTWSRLTGGDGGDNVQIALLAPAAPTDWYVSLANVIVCDFWYDIFSGLVITITWYDHDANVMNSISESLGVDSPVGDTFTCRASGAYIEVLRNGITVAMLYDPDLQDVALRPDGNSVGVALGWYGGTGDVYNGPAISKLCHGDFAGAAPVFNETPANAWTQIIKSADESDSSTLVMQNDNELFFQTEMGVVYEFGAWLKYAGAATLGNLSYTFGEDTAIRGKWSSVHFDTSGTPAPNSGQGKTDQTENGLAGSNLGGADGGVLVFGTHVGNGGIFRLRWCKGGSSGTPTTVRAGSILEYRALNP